MSLSEMDLEVTVASLRGDYQNMFGHDAGFDDLKDDLRTVVIAEHTANALESNPAIRFQNARDKASQILMDKKSHANLAKAMADAKTKYIAAGGSDADFENDRETIRREILRRAAMTDTSERDDAESRALAARTF